MISRKAEKAALVIAQHYPVLAITGPRQSGKTTLSKKLFPQKTYLNLEDLSLLEFATQDPKAFLNQYAAQDGAIIDEIQRAPHLFNYLQVLVDEKKQMGQFVITGSQQFGLLSQISQSLAGRAGFIQLLPFAYEELATDGHSYSFDELALKGFYPPVWDREIEPANWYQNYMRSYIERDIRQLVKVHDLALFQNFVRLCAGRTGQLLSLSELGNDCGISHNTARSWLSILEASYIVFLLQPYHRNYSKRLIKSPKLYFYDIGLASWLLGIRDLNHVVNHPLRGALFENHIVCEAKKAFFNRDIEPPLYFWRDSQGNEVDLLIQTQDGLLPIEIKSGQTINDSYFKGIRYWKQVAGSDLLKGAVVFNGEQGQQRTEADVWPWQNLDKVLLRAWS